MDELYIVARISNRETLEMGPKASVGRDINEIIEIGF